MSSAKQVGNDTPTERVGIIGLGIIGGVWAQNYERAGLLAASWNRSPKRESPKWCSDPASVARASSSVHLVVSDPGAVDEVLSAIEREL